MAALSSSNQFYGTDEQGRQALDAPVRGLLQGSCLVHS